MDNTTLLMDQAAAAAFMGISVTPFKRRRYSDKIRKYVDGLGYLTEAAGQQTTTEPKSA